MRLTRTAIGLLTAQYRSVLRKCFLINVGLYALLAPAASLTTATAVAVTAMPKTAEAALINVGPTETVDDLDGTYTNNGDITIENRGTINNITGTIINSYRAYWGAGIWTWNKGGPGLIKNIAARIINNRSEAIDSWDLDTSGAGIEIASEGKIDKIKNSIFIGNNVYNTTGGGTNRGGAIVNENGTIGEISDTLFLGNYVLNTDGGTSLGGAIYNINGNMNSISGTFINNYVQAKNGGAYGGAIGNAKNIGKIGTASEKALFIGNYAQSTSDAAQGGAIFNSGTISGDINADFIGNHVGTTNSTSNYSFGGAIYTNSSTYINVNGNFIGNYINTKQVASGGTLSSVSGVGFQNVNGNFIGNYAKSTGNYAEGGVIYGRARNVIGNFINNYVETDAADQFAMGGAINLPHGTDVVQGNFIGNKAIGTTDRTLGGAVVLSESSGTISGNFINNSVISTSGRTEGGAIHFYTTGTTISSLNADFINNSATSTSGAAKGGAIYNSGTITNLTGDFINNKATATSGEAYGGAIYNVGTISNVTGEFKGNTADGGATEQGAAILNDTSAATINITNSVFANNSGTGYGTINNLSGTLSLTDSSLYNNKTTDVAGLRSSGIASINAINKDVQFYGNKSTDSNIGYADIVSWNNGQMYYNAGEGKKIIFNGSIWGVDVSAYQAGAAPRTHINSDSDNKGGEYVFNNIVGYYHGSAVSSGYNSSIYDLYNGANVRFGNVRQLDGSVTYGSYQALATNIIDSTGATMNFANANADQTQNFSALTLNGNLKLGLDSGEKIAASSATGAGSILIDYINYASTPTGNQISWTYADSGNAVINKVANSTATVNTPYTTYKGSVVKNTTNNNQIDVTLSNGTENLVGFLTQNPTGTSYDMSRDEQILVDLDEGGRTMAGTTKTVNANGHNIIGNQHSGVTLADGQTLTINDANVEGFYKEDANGAVVNKGTVNINNSTFRNNVAKYTGAGAVYGGAIYSLSNIVDSSFYNNSVIGAVDGSNVQGGAIYKQANVYARTKDSIFEGNYSSGNGGAAFMTESSSFTGQNGHKVIFSNNSAGQRGGALLTYGSSTNTVSNAEFLYNSAGTGGAILNDATLNISDTLFKGNDANTGGAIQNDVSLSITNSTFENNTATSQGGAIYNAGTIGEFDANNQPVAGTGIINTTFKGNMANEGGAIYNSEGANISKLDNVKFVDNISSSEAGGIFNAGTISQISNSTFTGNMTTGGNGSAIKNEGIIGTLSADFISNTGIGSYLQGTIYNIGSITNISGTFRDNSLITTTETINDRSWGSSIYSTGSSTITSIVADFINNKDVAETGLAAGTISMYSSSHIVTLDGLFENNQAIGYEAKGSAITVSSPEATSGTSSERIDTITADFINNSAIGSSAAHGGAIYVGRSGGSIGSIGTSDNHAKFEGNYAQANTGDALGGAIYNSGTIDNIYADFKDNKATSASGSAEGGAIYNAGTIKNLTGRFENNGGDTTALVGGAIINRAGNIKITNSIFNNNVARAGGAIQNIENGRVILKDSQITENSGVFGGALYNNGNNSYFHIENVVARGNSTPNKNSLMEASGQVVIINSEITGNKGPGVIEIGNGSRTDETNIKTTLIDTNLTNNESTIDSYTPITLSGYYSANPTLNIVADSRDVNFKNNKILSGYYDIRMQGSGNTLNLNAAQNKSIDFGGSVTGSGTLNINKSGLTYTDLKDDGTFETETKDITQTGGKYIFRNQVSGQTMNLYNGANVQMRKLIQADGTPSYGRLWLSGFNSTGEGNILDVRNGVAQYAYTGEEVPEGATELRNFSLDKDVLYRIDVDLKNTEPGRSEALADYINGTYSSGSGKLVIDAINILQEGSKNDPWVASPGISSYVKLADTVHTYTTDYKDSYNVTYYKDSSNIGHLNFTDNGTTNLNLVGYLSNASSTGTAAYTMTSDEPVLRNISAMTGTTKTVNAGDYTINGNGFAGVTVGANQTLNINGGVWDGFAQNVMWTDGKNEININNAKFVNNKSTGSTGLVIDNSNSYIGEGFDKINITDSEISNNDAIYYVLNLPSDENKITADQSNVIFTNNKSGGGVIYSPQLTLEAKNKDIIFENNTGRAIYNHYRENSSSTISATGGSVTFSNNTSGGYGGAIYNEGTMAINSTATHRVKFENNESYGGAVFNSKKITNLDADFTGNNAKYRGGALWSYGSTTNHATIGTINGEYKDNYLTNDDLSQGGAIFLEKTDVTSISGKFENNYVTGSRDLGGGAIYSYLGNIGTITADFINNGSIGDDNNTRANRGGAISNDAASLTTIGATDDNVLFQGNKVTSSVLYGSGGAIESGGEITNIYADFTGNYVSVALNALGGGIRNGGIISKIGASDHKSTFTGNYVETSGTNAYGGGIANNKSIGTINADFTGNYAKSTGEYKEGAGGMVISKDTDDNQGSGRAYGGAIFNLAQVTKDDAGNITGVVENTGVIDSISGNFKNNYVYSENGYALGGAIYNEYGTIGQIGSAENKALFEGNKAESVNLRATGSALANNYGTINNIYADFKSNTAISHAVAEASATLSNIGGIIGNIVGDFISNKVASDVGSAVGGAILNGGGDYEVVIENIQGNYRDNSVSSLGEAWGGAIYNSTRIKNIGATHKSYVITENSAISKETRAIGGAVTNFGTIGTLDTETSTLLADNTGIINTSFTGNYVRGNDQSTGGAIFNSGNINLSALQSDVNFWNNKANDRYNDIYNSGTMNFNAAQNKTMSFGGSIEGTGAININTGATNGGTYVFKSDVSAGNVVVGSADSGYAPASLSFEKAKQEDGSITNGTFDVDSLTINGDGNSLSTRNDKVDTNSATTLTLNNALNLQIDGDLQSHTGDSIAVSNLTAAAPKSLRLTAMNFTTDPDVTTLSKTDTIDVNITGENDILAQNNAYTLASTNPDDTTEEQIEQAYLNNLTSSSGNYNKTYAFRSAKLMTSDNNQTYVQYGDNITLKWLYENYINGWKNGKYILNNVIDGKSADTTHLTVGQALTALDSALGQNDTYNFATQSVADVLVNNYYTKLVKKDEKFDTNEGIMDVKSLKKDTNSSQGRIIKGVSAFPSIMCAYPFDMPHTANDNHKTVFGRQSDNTATTTKQAA